MSAKIKQLEGRDHFICPVVMVVGNTVLNGSGGPIFYPSEVLEASVMAWNGRPVVVYYPNQNGIGYAGHPEVFTKQRIGTLFNARFEAGKLKAEAWLDVQRVNAVDGTIAACVRRNVPVEVSTGLIVHCGNAQTADGAAIASAVEPDHLAILPTGKGACSIADGAGLCVNAVDVLELPAYEF